MLEADMEFYPLKDAIGDIAESPENYIKRMKIALPRWPDEVLCEWLYRHADNISDYSFLDFRTFSFELQTWPIEKIPGREAFRDPRFCDPFPSRSALELYIKEGVWLAKYMVECGTWNTPIILLDNPHRVYKAPQGWWLGSPFHLLEGHKRLCFLNGLRINGEAKSAHRIWLVRKELR